MKLNSIIIFRMESGEKPIIVASAFDLSEFGFFQRGTAKEFVTFTSRTVAHNTQPLSRAVVKENDKQIFSHSFDSGKLVITVVGSDDYNQRVAFSMMSEIVTKFPEDFPPTKVHQPGQVDHFLSWPYLDTMLQKWQNPAEHDKIMKIQQDLDSTKIVMHDAIEKMLERGEKLDKLVDDSGDLSAASKGFYKQAKKTNSSCCSVM